MTDLPITRNDILAKSPCTEALEWMHSQPDASLRELWDTCPRGDWMIWILQRFSALDRRQWVRLACTLVRETPMGDGRTVWDLLTDERSRQAMTITEAWLNGEASIEDVKIAAYAAYVATYAAADAADAAAYAAYVAADAADAIAYAAYVATYAAYVAADAADAAAYVAYVAARVAAYAAYVAADVAAYVATYAARAVQADIVRRVIDLDMLMSGGAS